jgi:hypothetical protein
LNDRTDIADNHRISIVCLAIQLNDGVDPDVEAACFPSESAGVEEGLRDIVRAVLIYVVVDECEMSLASNSTRSCIEWSSMFELR